MFRGTPWMEYTPTTYGGKSASQGVKRKPSGFVTASQISRHIHVPSQDYARQPASRCSRGASAGFISQCGAGIMLGSEGDCGGNDEAG